VLEETLLQMKYSESLQNPDRVIKYTEALSVMKIVAVSGGFDPLHIGHIRYFKEAKKLGDKLIVILNTDEFLKKKKGFNFMSYEERKETIRAIKHIDEVYRCRDTDQSVCKTLRMIKPDIFAKGGDRTLGNIPEREVCEELGIEMVFGVGGGKVQSSSWLLGEFKKDLTNIIEEIQKVFEEYNKHLKKDILIINLKKIIKKYRKN